MTRRRRRRGAGCAYALILSCALLAPSGCATLVDGRPGVADASLRVQGDSGGVFDTLAKNSLSDIIAFWQRTYPRIADGKPLPALRGKLYSVDGTEELRTKRAAPAAAGEACAQKQPLFVVDNAAYCELDDSIIWDRSPTHLLPVLTEYYGPTVTALVFAHEFGHAVQHRLGIDDNASSGTKTLTDTIHLESQADCAAGAFIGSALAGDAPHLAATQAGLDRALDGYLLIRDDTPTSDSDVSHGNGFDRLSAVEDGVVHGASFCFAPAYLHRTFTERGYGQNLGDQEAGGNQPMQAVLNSDELPRDLDRFWTSAGSGLGKHFTPAHLTEAAHPSCSATSEFGYCPDDNTVSYSPAIAARAYDSLTAIAVDRATGDVVVQRHQPADYALGELIALGWAMSARHQFFGGSTTDRSALLAAVCYTGGYAHDINRAEPSRAHPFVLSPPDMDEATSAVLELVPLKSVFGARGTTGLQRIQAFVTGYDRGLPGC